MESEALDERDGGELRRQLAELQAANECLRGERDRETAERRQAEDALRQSESQLHRLFDSGLVGVLFWDWDGGIFDANDAFLTMLGYDRDDLRAGRVNWRTATPPEYVEQDLRIQETLRTVGVSGAFEKEYYRKDGSRLYVLMFGAVLDERRGIAFVIDLTRHKQTEQALRESEARFRQLADAMPQIVWAARPDGYFDYYNAKWYALTGTTEGTGGDQSWLPVLHPDDRQRAREAWYDSVRNGRPYQIEYRFKFPHAGEYRWHLARALPVRDHVGNIVRWYGTCTDIHDQKRAAEAVRESEARFRGIFENAAVGMAQVDRNGRWLQVNQTLCEIVGYSCDELLRSTFQEITHPDDLEADLDLFAPLMRGEIASYSIEKRFIHRQGHVIWVNLTTAVQREAGGAPLFGIGIIEDVTSRKRAEQELRELNETLEQRIAQRTAQLRLLATELTQAEQRERRRLAYVLHEDIQQLMVAVKMKVGQLGRRAPELLRGDVDQAERLLHELIQASRSLAVQLSPPILYDAGLGPALEWLGRKLADEYGLTIHVEADERVEPADQNISLFLLQAVRELLLNTVKYSGTSEAFVTLRGTDREQVQIVVEDRGVGMDPEQLHATEATADRFGLFSIEHRLGLLGGSFTLESAPGEGMRITLTAPVRTPHVKTIDPASPAPPAAAAAVPGNGSRIRVLLVDDHRILRQGLARLLAGEADMEVIGEAADGAQAVEMARQLRPDVVCMDMTMPRMNGIEATRQIMAENPRARVIGLSMHETADMAAALMAAGAVNYLSKDGPSDELIHAIRTAAGRATTTEPAP